VTVSGVKRRFLAVIYLALFCSSHALPNLLGSPANSNRKKSFMKKNVLLITVTLALGLSGVGCNKSGKLNTASKFKPPAGPMELKVKWPVGEHIVQNLDFKQSSEISMPNQPVPIKQEMTMGQGYALSVLKATSDGGCEVEMEFLNFRMKMEMGGKPMVDYDSGKKSPDDSANPAAEMLKKVIGAKIQCFMDASNRVERVEGVDALVERMTSSGSADATTGIKSMFNEGYFKQIMDGSRYLTSKPVEPGDTWPVQLEIPMGPLGIMEMNYTVTFHNWEQHGKRTCARLEFEGTIKSKPDSNNKMAGMTMTISDGNASGVSWFDPELGTCIETTANQDMKVNMTMTMPSNPRGNAAAGKTQTFTSLMKQVVTVKLESVK
jgi:hypothetical protein